MSDLCLWKVTEFFPSVLKKAYLPPMHWAAMKKTAFNTETLPTVSIQTVTAGLSCPPETCWIVNTKVAMLSPWLKAMWIIDGEELFHGKTVPQTMNKNKRVTNNSAITSIQNERDFSSIFYPHVPSSQGNMKCDTVFLCLLGQFPTAFERCQNLGSKFSGCYVIVQVTFLCRSRDVKNGKLHAGGHEYDMASFTFLTHLI